MNRTLKATALAAVGAYALAACSAFEIHGTVTGKQYIPGYYTYSSDPVYSKTCNSKTTVSRSTGLHDSGSHTTTSMTCTKRLTGYKEDSTWHYACWQLSVAGSQGGDECVSESQYDNTTLGDKV